MIKEPQAAKHSELELWEQVASDDGNQEARDRLIHDYTPLVKAIAAKLYTRRIDDIADFDDYMQYGLVGLIESVGRYDTNSNASFKTYASYRIVGSILNGLEKTSEYRTQHAHKTRLVKERVESISEGSSDDLFVHLVDSTIYMALGYILDDVQRDNAPENLIQGRNYTSTEMRIIQQQLKHIIEKIPLKESAIVKYHYFHYVSFEEIGEILGLTKGRVSQLHKSALQHIREIFEEESGLDILY